MKALKEISKLVKDIQNETEVEKFFQELLTEAEIDTLSKRWRILEMLNQGKTQREIAKELQVSLCKVTRGAKILKNKSSMLAKYMANN
ncbi:helix-turn-helix domain-containing protein [bacterium]|nr:helix-turn-helix domain-containing protein [bacterium]